MSTVDMSLKTGSEIPIEERDGEEIRNFRGERVAERETDVVNPAFDVTPNHLVSAIITEKGVARGDLAGALAGMQTD